MRTPWFTHPLFVFIFSLIALATSLFLYIRSYLQVNEAFDKFLRNQKLDRAQFLQTETWVNIVILSVLVAIILLGLLLIYIYYSKVIQLYKQQQNFINGFTHELKTPIASLRLFLDGLSRHELKREDQLRYLQFMKKDVERLTDNVNQILNLAKLEDKSYTSQFEIVDFPEYFYLLAEKLAAQYRDHHIVWDTPAEITPVQVMLERGLIEMALANLISNGLNYNHASEKKIELKLSVRKRWLEILVVDNGIGMEKRELKRVFKKFYQIGDSTKGSGLGLYIVGQIMKLHKGKVDAKSEGLGHGAEFRLSFPIRSEGSV